MLTLSGSDRKQLREAIQSAYPDPDDLKLFVDEELGKNIATFTSSGKLRQVVSELIGEAIAKGFIDRLILALEQDTENSYIRRFCARVLPQYLQINGNEEAIAASLPLDNIEASWGLETTSEELQLFLPKQFSFEADVGELRRGLELARAVCKITFANLSAADNGTGVLVAPDLVLTNYHVLSLETGADLNAIVQSASFRFGDVSTRLDRTYMPQVRVAAKTDAVAMSSPINQLDYVLIRLNPPAEADEEKSAAPAIEPVELEQTSVLSARSPLHILQHPEGEQMKVSLSNNGIVKTNPKRGLVLYVNATRGGSSGSPCFNEEWKLVALHHKALSTSFGSVREGVLLSAIYPEIEPFLVGQ